MQAILNDSQPNNHASDLIVLMVWITPLLISIRFESLPKLTDQSKHQSFRKTKVLGK